MQGEIETNLDESSVTFSVTSHEVPHFSAVPASTPAAPDTAQ